MSSSSFTTGSTRSGRNPTSAPGGVADLTSRLAEPLAVDGERGGEGGDRLVLQAVRRDRSGSLVPVIDAVRGGKHRSFPSVARGRRPASPAARPRRAGPRGRPISATGGPGAGRP